MNTSQIVLAMNGFSFLIFSLKPWRIVFARPDPDLPLYVLSHVQKFARPRSASLPALDQELPAGQDPPTTWLGSHWRYPNWSLVSKTGRGSTNRPKQSPARTSAPRAASIALP